MPKELQPASGALRRRLFEVVFHAEDPAARAFDVVLIVAILTSVGVVMLDSVESLRADYRGAVLHRGVVLHGPVHVRVPAPPVDRPPAAALRAQLLRARGPALDPADVREPDRARSRGPALGPHPALAPDLPGAQAGQLPRRGRPTQPGARGEQAQDPGVHLRGAHPGDGHGLDDVPDRGGRERVRLDPPERLLGRRDGHDGRLRRHLAGHAAGPGGRADAHDHGLRDHRGADGDRDGRVEPGPGPGPPPRAVPPVPGSTSTTTTRTTASGAASTCSWGPETSAPPSWRRRGASPRRPSHSAGPPTHDGPGVRPAHDARAERRGQAAGSYRRG